MSLPKIFLVGFLVLCLGCQSGENGSPTIVQSKEDAEAKAAKTSAADAASNAAMLKKMTLGGVHPAANDTLLLSYSNDPDNDQPANGK